AGPADRLLRQPADGLAVGRAQSRGGDARLAPTSDGPEPDPSLRHDRAKRDAQGHRSLHPLAERARPGDLHPGARVAQRLSAPEAAGLTELRRARRARSGLAFDSAVPKPTYPSFPATHLPASSDPPHHLAVQPARALPVVARQAVQPRDRRSRGSNSPDAHSRWIARVAVGSGSIASSTPT